MNNPELIISTSDKNQKLIDTSKVSADDFLAMTAEERDELCPYLTEDQIKQLWERRDEWGMNLFRHVKFSISMLNASAAKEKAAISHEICPFTGKMADIEIVDISKYYNGWSLWVNESAIRDLGNLVKRLNVNGLVIGKPYYRSSHLIDIRLAADAEEITGLTVMDMDKLGKDHRNNATEFYPNCYRGDIAGFSCEDRVGKNVSICNQELPTNIQVGDIIAVEAFFRRYFRAQVTGIVTDAPGLGPDIHARIVDVLDYDPSVNPVELLQYATTAELMTWKKALFSNDTATIDELNNLCVGKRSQATWLEVIRLVTEKNAEQLKSS